MRSRFSSLASVDEAHEAESIVWPTAKESRRADVFLCSVLHGVVLIHAEPQDIVLVSFDGGFPPFFDAFCAAKRHEFFKHLLTDVVSKLGSALLIGDEVHIPFCANEFAGRLRLYFDCSNVRRYELGRLRFEERFGIEFEPVAV